MIKVVFFAALREQLNCEALSLPSENIQTIADVKTRLQAKSKEWHSALTSSSLLVAVNHTMVDNTHIVNDNDEVAFFPPVTGG
jgi:molybdopterin synthase sulfur carrier subunit